MKEKEGRREVEKVPVYYILVVRCKRSRPEKIIRLSSPPDFDANPINEVVTNIPCVLHPEKEKIKNTHNLINHSSMSVVVKVPRLLDGRKTPEAEARKKARPLFRKKAKELAKIRNKLKKIKNSEKTTT